jgi:hypothetical protein
VTRTVVVAGVHVVGLRQTLGLFSRSEIELIAMCEPLLNRGSSGKTMRVP